MTWESNKKVAIVRTERGLTIQGTRVTIYDVMDHLVSGTTTKVYLELASFNRKAAGGSSILVRLVPCKSRGISQT